MSVYNMAMPQFQVTVERESLYFQQRMLIDYALIDGVIDGLTDGFD